MIHFNNYLGNLMCPLITRRGKNINSVLAGYWNRMKYCHRQSRYIESTKKYSAAFIPSQYLIIHPVPKDYFDYRNILIYWEKYTLDNNNIEKISLPRTQFPLCPESAF